MDNFVY